MLVTIFIKSCILLYLHPVIVSKTLLACPKKACPPCTVTKIELFSDQNTSWRHFTAVSILLACFGLQSINIFFNRFLVLPGKLCCLRLCQRKKNQLYYSCLHYTRVVTTYLQKKLNNFKMKIIFVFHSEIVLFLHFEPGISVRSYFWVKRTQILQKLQRLSSDFAALMPKWRLSGWAFADKQVIKERWVLCRRCRSWLQVSHQRQTITIIHPRSSQVNYYREMHCYEFINKLNLT